MCVTSGFVPCMTRTVCHDIIAIIISISSIISVTEPPREVHREQQNGVWKPLSNWKVSRSVSRTRIALHHPPLLGMPASMSVVLLCLSNGTKGCSRLWLNCFVHASQTDCQSCFPRTAVTLCHRTKAPFESTGEAVRVSALCSHCGAIF